MTEAMGRFRDAQTPWLTGPRVDAPAESPSHRPLVSYRPIILRLFNLHLTLHNIVRKTRFYNNLHQVRQH